MARRGSKVAEAYVEISGDTSKLDTSLDQTKTKVTETTAKIEGENAKIDKSFSTTAESVQASVSKQVGVITGLVGAVTSAIGVFTLFFQAGQRIRSVIDEDTTALSKASDEFELFTRGLGGNTSEAIKALRDLQNEAATTLANLRRNFSSFKNVDLAVDAAQFVTGGESVSELEATQERIAGLIERLRVQQGRQREAARQSRLDALREENALLESQVGGPLEEIQEKRRQLARRRRDELREEKDAELRREYHLRSVLQLKLLREQEDAIRETFRKAISDAFRESAREGAAQFGDDVAVVVSEIQGLLKASLLQRRSL